MHYWQKLVPMLAFTLIKILHQFYTQKLLSRKTIPYLEGGNVT